MKIESLNKLLSESIVTIKRFPVTLIFAVSCTVSLCVLVNQVDTESRNLLTHLLMTFYLGMVADICLNIFCERYKIRKLTGWILKILLFGLMFFYYSTLPSELTITTVARFALLVIATHLGVSFGPFIVESEINGFWQYNKLLFLRFLTSQFYSGVLFIGISLALLAIDNLFEVNLSEKSYLYSFFILSGIFSVLFFLSGIPDKIAGLDLVHDYPKGLKIFTQFVLLPLVTIYLLILYAYASKILFTMDWPRGWVSYLVIGFSVAGIFALLLVWPLRDKDDHLWIRNYTRFFFLALFPLILLLALSIGKRVLEYGITENRYFVIILAIWLFLNAIYFLFSDVKNIKVIPMSLYGFALLAGFGPWNAFQVSEKNQLNRLQKVLIKNNMYVNEKILHSKKGMEIVDEVKVSGILNYLIDVHGLSCLQPMFTQNLDSLVAHKPDVYINKTEKVMKLMGLNYPGYGDFNEYEKEGERNLRYSCIDERYTNVSGYDYQFSMSVFTQPSKQNFNQTIKLDSVSFSWNYKKGEWLIKSQLGENETIEINLKPLLLKLLKEKGASNFNLPAKEMQIDFVGNKIKGRYLIKGLQGVQLIKNDELDLSSVDGIMLINVNNE